MPARMEPRTCVVLRGGREETRAGAERVIARLERRDVLWVGGDPPEGVTAVAPRGEARLLGRAFDAVVIDLHDQDGALDPDVLGRCHGFVRGGGALILRTGRDGVPASEALAAFPHAPTEVTRRFWARFERVLARHGVMREGGGGDGVSPIAIPTRTLEPSADQARVVATLVERLRGPAATLAVVSADRGRGKSAALGLALRALVSEMPGLRVVASAMHEGSLSEVRRFFGPADLEIVSPAALVAPGAAARDVVVIDEAAQMPVPLLRRIVRRHAQAHVVFATTVRGYEGTGRGFALRFLPWLEGDPRPLAHLALSAPIRWAAGCPLEALVFDALLLDAELAEVGRCEVSDLGGFVARAVDREALAGQERALRELFGLLVQAHYRTTPGDLMRLLDAPNLAVHVLEDGARGRIVAACLVAREGALPEASCDDMLRGRRRIRAHALADALVTHLGRRDAGRLTMLRSVRIAVHPQLRRLGLGRRLVEHVHASYRPDLFGTIFGATAELIAFRRAFGYHVVRVSASRGSRTGEPAVMMLRPESDAARALVDALRGELARDLPRQLELFARDGDLLLEPALERALRDDHPAAAPLDVAARDALVRAYAEGPRTMESVAGALASYLSDHPEKLARLDPSARALVTGRIIEGRGWGELAHEAGLAHAGLAMRALRRHVQTIID